MWRARSFTRFKVKPAIANTNIREPQIMGEVFHGWRRKTGCVTLLIALAFAAAWVRSLTMVERVNYYGSVNCYRWTSRKGVFEFEIFEHNQVVPHEILESISWQHRQVTPNDSLTNADLFEMPWGVYFRRQQEPFKQFLFIIRYGLIVVPLTIISVLLLLNKPRKRKPESTDSRTGIIATRTDGIAPSTIVSG